jgi:hypothetical protein
MFRSLKVVGGIALAFAFLLVPTTQWLKPANSAAVKTERQVQIPIGSKMKPVVITKVTLGDTVVQAGRMATVEPITPFQAGDDWIQNLTIHLYNRTNKTIVFAQVLFGFPETGDGRAGAAGQPPRAFLLQLGRIPPPAPSAGHQPTDWQPISFLPGQTMAIRLGDYIDRIRFQVEPVLPVAAVTQLIIQLNIFYFADGMEYSGNAFKIHDPQNPGKALHADPNYFPGNMNLSWPGRPDWTGGRKKQ